MSKKFALLACLCLAAPLVGAQGSLTVAGVNTGSIPDNTPSGRAVSFAVSGLTGPLTGVSVQMELSHGWLGDLRAELIAPGGVSRMVVFSRVGATRSESFGAQVVLDGLYRFADDAGEDLWLTAATTSPLPPDSYRASTTGAPDLADGGGCLTYLDRVFGGLSAAQATGNWTLVVADLEPSFVGSVTAASLELQFDNRPPDIFSNGFEAAPPGAAAAAAGETGPGCRRTLADLTGNGLTDYVLLRNQAGQLAWDVTENAGEGSLGAASIFVFGNSGTDTVLAADIEGDGIADAIVWRPLSASEGLFEVRRSSSPGLPPLQFRLGRQGSVATVAADYDGDGVDDLATVTAPSIDGPIELEYLRSSDGQRVGFSLGNGVAAQLAYHAGYDFSGDGAADIAVRRPGAGGAADFTIYHGQTGAVLDSVSFGQSSDALVPGNYSGSELADLVSSRNEAGTRAWRVRETGTGTELPPVAFGASGDFLLGGDYDGDGIADFAVYNPTGGTSGGGRVRIRPSTAPATPWEINVGATLTFPLANFRVQ